MDTADIEVDVKYKPGDEVQRLQELVRQLEVQNQMLRTKHSESDPTLKLKKDTVTNDMHISKDLTSDENSADNDVQKDNRKSIDGMKNDISEEFDVLDVSTVPAFEDEESW